MNKAFKGWQYIKVLLDYMETETDKRREHHLVSPKYIYRGVTQRWFTSSDAIKDLLLTDTSVLEEQIGIFNSRKQQKVINDAEKCKNDPECLRELERIFYKNKKELLMHEITKMIEEERLSPNDILSSIIKKGYYNNYIVPQYIRSGAAVRLCKQCNRTSNDYIAYLRNLINETKSRFPSEYAKYSDLEILADIQHKGGASCLVDYSENFLVSLWFATQDYANKSCPEIGYLYCYDINTDSIEDDNLKILNKDNERDDIEKLIFETSKLTKFNGKDSSHFYLWKPSSINSRIARQDSVFIFGIEKFKISEHHVIIIPIPHEWKEEIQYALKELFCIYGESIYADASGLFSTNTKIDPIKTQTEYFVENYLTENESKIRKLCSVELMQKATSALMKAQYDIALSYFSSFEGTNFEIINNDAKVSGIYSPEIYNRQMLLIELYYSKGICLSHLKKPAESLTHYTKAIELNLKLLSTIDDAYARGESAINEKYNDLRSYAKNKLFKILEDYISILYEAKHYYDAYMQLSKILNIFDDNSDDNYLMRVLIKTACNEVKTLASLYENPRLDNVSIDFDSDERKSFCKVLNRYFTIIDKLLNDSIGIVV